ncbi:MAG: hypothetical protein H6Q73_2047 [Firmicutes bacterium]|nr:hypothetical protein [Bacillota bacterium]
MKDYNKYSVHKLLITPIDFFGGPKVKDKLNALQWLSDKVEISDLEYIYPLVFEKNMELGLAAAKIVKEVMGNLTMKQWGNIYDELKYFRVDKDELTLFLRYPEEISVHLLGIATLNANGYIREKALSMMSGIQTSEAIPYVLLRLGDWVERIRKISVHILRNTLKEENIDSYVSNFHLIDKLKGILRVDLKDVREEIISYLKEEAALDKIKANLVHPNVKIRLFCYTILQNKLVTENDIIKLALSDKAFEIRLWLIGAIEEIDYNRQIEVIKRLLHDKAAKVKVAALRRFEKIIVCDFREELFEMLCDEHTSVREGARYIVRRYSMLEDFPVFYREQISTQASPGAILGLGETGKQIDYTLISKFTSSENMKIKCATITAMWYLSKDASVKALVRCLDSEIPRVRKTAKRLLRSEKSYFVFLRMKEKLGQDNPEMKLYALEIIYRYGGWQALDSIMMVICQEDGIVLTHAVKMLERWLCKSARIFTKPDSETLTSLENNIQKAREKQCLSCETLKILEFIIATRR